MFKKIATTALSLIAIAAVLPAHAEPKSCSIEVAVATPPIDYSQNVAFNVVNDQGFSRSVTIPGGSAPYTISNLSCSDAAYLVTATTYTTPSNKELTGFSDCVLKSDNGNVWLRYPNSSVSVVFPNDFSCH